MRLAALMPIMNIYVVVRFQVLMAASMKFRVFWDVALCSQVYFGQNQLDYMALHPG
jgi:hypothetical protein